jgi:hypothetical protein
MCTHQFCVKAFLSVHLRQVKVSLGDKFVIKLRMSGIEVNGTVSQNLTIECLALLCID